MKTTLAFLAIMTACWTSSAVDKSGLDRRIEKLTAKFAAMQQKSDKRVPPDVLKKAQAIFCWTAPRPVSFSRMKAVVGSR